MRIITLILGLAVLLLASVGQVTGLSGQVNIDRAGKTLKAEIGAMLENGDRIKTASEARAQLVFNDDTVITLGNNSDFVIEEVDFASAQPKARFAAAKGAFKVMTGQIAKAAPQGFELKSRTALIGIRGTHFLGVIGADGDTVACTDGRIVVASQTLGGEVSVPAGQLTQVMMNQAPMPPRAYTASELRKLSASAAGEKSENGAQPQPGEGEAEEGKNEAPALSLTDVLRDVAPLGKESWIYYDGWFYTTQSEFAYEWEGSGATVTHFTPVSSYIEWGKTSESYTFTEEELAYLKEELAAQGVDPESVTLPSSLTFAEYFAYPAGGYAVTSLMPTSGIRNFTGQVAGGVMASSQSGLIDRGEIITSSSQVNMTADFSAMTTSGDMSFSTTGGSNWDVGFTGTISGSSFSNTVTSGAYGSMDGYFVGPNAEAAGGDFFLVNESGEIASGVFSLK